MNTCIKLVIGLTILTRIAQSQETMIFQNWTFLSDSNVTVLFAKNEHNTNYLIIPIKSYYIALDNYLFKNDKVMSFVEELNIEFVYDEYVLNEGPGDSYLVFDEKNIFTTYGRELRMGVQMCPYHCITEILFNESLRKNPDFVIIDDFYLSDIEGFAYNSNYQPGSWIDTAKVIIEKGTKIRLDSKNRESKHWITYDLFIPYSMDTRGREQIDMETRIRIRKLPRIMSYHAKAASYIIENNGYLSQWMQNSDLE